MNTYIYMYTHYHGFNCYLYPRTIASFMCGYSYSYVSQAYRESFTLKSVSACISIDNYNELFQCKNGDALSILIHEKDLNIGYTSHNGNTSPYLFPSLCPVLTSVMKNWSLPLLPLTFPSCNPTNRDKNKLFFFHLKNGYSSYKSSK